MFVERGGTVPVGNARYHEWPGSTLKVSGVAELWDACIAKGLQEALKLIRTAAARKTFVDIEQLVSVMQDSQYLPVSDLTESESDAFGRYAASYSQISHNSCIIKGCRSPAAVILTETVGTARRRAVRPVDPQRLEFGACDVLLQTLNVTEVH